MLSRVTDNEQSDRSLVRPRLGLILEESFNGRSSIVGRVLNLASIILMYPDTEQEDPGNQKFGVLWWVRTTSYLS